ncbi:diguanylate cyclase domain-containing protein [Oricola nitratireducens]|uniref:diguanylate cyclase domain-containing protein n=1 Tax=Oricola nitratireducens TaxID=2775868 RepID=UPI0018685E6C|nr:diguanylate cyclase [Oricola nitratireducens]
MQPSNRARAGSAAPVNTVYDRLLAATPDDLVEQLLTFQAILDHFPGGISVIDSTLRLVAYNEQFKSMHGYPDSMFEPDPPHLEDIFRFNAERGEYGPGDVEEILAERLALVRKREAHHYERWRSNGSLIEVRGAPLAGGGFVTTYFDITETWHNQNIIHHMAHHDQLTDLANRRLLGERLNQALAAARHGTKFAVHCLDLDKFKPVNDTHGHAVGDEVLKLVAERLRRFSRQGDTVARIGGDEFVLIQAGIGGRGDAEALAKRIELEMLQPFTVDDETIRIGTSVGMALAPDDGADAETLFQIADAALYEAKNAKHVRQADDGAWLKRA